MISALQVVEPPAVEPVTVEFAKRHIRLDHDGDDDLVAFYIGTARALAETFLARVLITQTLRWTVMQSPPSTGWPLASVPVSLLVFPQWVTPDMIGRQPLLLPRQPVQAVASVAIGGSAGLGSDLPTSSYSLNADTGALHLRNFAGLAPGRSLSVQFTAGYGNAPADVPRPIVNAILLMTAGLYENRGDDGAGALPPAAESLLTPYRLVNFGG